MVPDLRRIPAVIVEVHNPPIPLSRTHRRLRRPRTTRLQGPVTADLISTIVDVATGEEFHVRIKDIEAATYLRIHAEEAPTPNWHRA
jgi:hypothetical protein